MELNRLRELAGIRQLNEAKSSKTSKTPMEILNHLAAKNFGEFGFATLEHDDQAKLVNIKDADEIAINKGERGIATCSEDLMKQIFNENPSLLIGEAATNFKKLGAK
jgi:hypothetical protein